MRFYGFRIDRFSLYWATPNVYGITNLRPALPYRLINHSLTEDDLNELAYHFEADYADASASYAPGMKQAIKTWKACKGAVLDVFRSEHSIRIIDTRPDGEQREYNFDGLAVELYLQCDAAQSVHRLMGIPSVRACASEEQVVTLLEQFVEQGLMIRSGKQYLSLAVVREGIQYQHAITYLGDHRLVSQRPGPAYSRSKQVITVTQGSIKAAWNLTQL